MLFLLALFFTIHAHNWIHSYSRAAKASQLLPAPPRAGPRQPHLQVGAGQTFGVEFVTGHPGSFYYFVVLKATDENRLKDHSETMLNQYIADAPAEAYLYNDDMFQRMHVSCSHNYPNNPIGRGDCSEGRYNDGTRYERKLTAADALFFERPAAWVRGTSEMTHFKYKPADLARDARVSYENPQFPWIEAVHKFGVNYRHPKEWDVVRFSLPARQGSGEYLIHMLWRGYRDVIDVDVLPEPAADMYGRLGASDDREWVKTDHCEYPNYSLRNNRCYIVPPNGSLEACMSWCMNRFPGKCQAINVVPLFKPGNVKLDVEPNIPWGEARRCTKPANMANYDKDSLVCYGFIPSTPRDPTFNPETEDKWYVRETDPEDPIFYSTCYRVEGTRVFEGNVACPACEGEEIPKRVDWAIGDKCLSCEDVESEDRFGFAKLWEVHDVCEKCF